MFCGASELFWWSTINNDNQGSCCPLLHTGPFHFPIYAKLKSMQDEKKKKYRSADWESLKDGLQGTVGRLMHTHLFAHTNAHATHTRTHACTRKYVCICAYAHASLCKHTLSASLATLPFNPLTLSSHTHRPHCHACLTTQQTSMPAHITLITRCASLSPTECPASAVRSWRATSASSLLVGTQRSRIE